jgi:hypothetical protein
MAQSSQYNHQQTTPSTTWTVNHNLGSTIVACDCVVDYQGHREKILPLNVVVVDENQVVVTFTNNETGSVRIVTK